MITNEQELQGTLERLQRFHRQVTQIRRVETDPETYRMSAGGFLAEIDRMNLEVREYLSSLPAEAK